MEEMNYGALSCAHCGGMPIVEKVFGEYSIRCMCGIEIGFTSKDVNKIIGIWNRRVQPIGWIPTTEIKQDTASTGGEEQNPNIRIMN